MRENITTYLILLSTTLAIPVAIWLIAAAQIFTHLRGFTPENYQEQVRDNLSETLIDKTSELLNHLFPQYGLTPSRNAPFSTIIRNLLNEVEEGERLTFIANMYNNLVENGINSPFFYQQIVQAFLSMMGGGNSFWARLTSIFHSP